MKKIVLIFCLIFSFIVTFLFAKDRFIGYANIPDNRIFDERNYVLQGISLIKNGLPIGYSDSGDYMEMPENVHDTKLSGLSIAVNGVSPSHDNLMNIPKPVFSINEFDFGFGKQHIKFVQPFFDHPPLGGLIYSLGILGSAEKFQDIQPEGYRIPAQYLAVITSLLIFIVSFLVFNNPIVALLSVVAYNSVPSYLLITRYALLENIVAPLSLLMIALLITYLKSQKKGPVSLLILLFSGFTAGLTILAKESGIGFLLAGIIILIMFKAKNKQILSYIVAAVFPVIVYFAWGMHLAPKLFIDILIFNASRGFLGSLNFINIFQWVGFKNFPFDGWWTFGFLSMILLFYDSNKKNALILLSFGCELFVILFLSGVNYPWYYFGLLPYLSIAMGFTLRKLIKKPDAVLLSIFFLFPFSSTFYWGYTVFHLPPQSTIYRLLIIIFTLTSIIRLRFSKHKFVNYGWKVFTVSLIILIVILNHRAFLYILSNWNNLPIPKFPVL